MAKTTTSQKHAQLKKLSQQTRENIYEMLSLANDILADHDYVDQFGGEDVLIEHMENTEFAHFGGSPKLKQMLHAFAKSPDKETWEEYRYNVWALIDLANPPKTKGSGEQRHDWKKEAQELRLEVKSLKAALEEASKVNADLREKQEELMIANGELRGEIKAIRGQREREYAR